ncbi:FAD-dependent oxidoreductase, partial [Candidatus Aerophobetes bacterium]|nr:FAD-dependent oxidoreductase [Candidatus Aerophobetes bacterium]
CCMHATKEAIIAKEGTSGSNITCHIYFMDMRCFGKDFDRYYERARKKCGVEYRRSRVAAVKEDPETSNLRIRYESEEGELKEEEYDLVVLSLALDPPSGTQEVVQKLGIELNDYGFARVDPFFPVQTSREGIYVCGAVSSPKDIPETVVQASGAAAMASSLLSEVRGKLTEKKHYPPEVDVSDEEPRIGVFVCRCGMNIGGTVDIPRVVELAGSLPAVVYVEENLQTCSQGTQEKMKEAIRKHQLNRVVVACGTVRTHEPLFQETLKDAGLNRCLFEMVNIRDQCSWVHANEPEAATVKSMDLVRMGIAKARGIQPLDEQTVPVTKSAIVVGGGVSGLTAALNIAEQGFQCSIIEKGDKLGGNLLSIKGTLNGDNLANILKDLTAKVKKNNLITVFNNS